MNTLIQCIYSSIAHETFNEEHIPMLLEKARLANAQRHITGMLTYINGSFLQVVEGEEHDVDELFLKIKGDRRHTRVTIWARQVIVERSFANWSMGFEALLMADVGEIVGENDFFESGSCLSSLDAGIAKTILSAFLAAQTAAPPSGNRVPDKTFPDRSY